MNEEQEKKIKELANKHAPILGVTEEYLEDCIHSAINGIESYLLLGKGKGRPIGLL